MADGGIAPPPDASSSAEPPADASMSAEPPDDAGTSAEPPSSDWGDADPFGSDATMPLQPDPLLGIAGPFNGRIFAFGGFGLMLKSEDQRSEEHTSELQSLMRNSYAVFCLKTTKY